MHAARNHDGRDRGVHARTASEHHLDRVREARRRADDDAMDVDDGCGSGSPVSAEDARQRVVDAALDDELRELSFVRERIDALGVELCPVCQDAPCGVILAGARARFAVRASSGTHRPSRPTRAERLGGGGGARDGGGGVPMCRRDVVGDSRGVVRGGGTKTQRIADLCESIDEPVLVFVQWKSMLRSLRAILKGRGLRAYTLEGKLAPEAEGAPPVCRRWRPPPKPQRVVRGPPPPAHAPRRLLARHRRRRERRAQHRVPGHRAVPAQRQSRQVVVHTFVVADCDEDVLWNSTHRVTVPTADETTAE